MNDTRPRPLVMVSGCYDLLHLGHLYFFEKAKALGKYLLVTVAGDNVLVQHKHRISGLPADQRLRLVQALKPVDEAVLTELHELGFDFLPVFLEIEPDVLAVTEDDHYADEKQALCEQHGVRYAVIPKMDSEISTTAMRRRIGAKPVVPMRVDFAGGWLDVPRLADPSYYIVNCAIKPLVSIVHWPYRQNAGIGGSAAHNLLTGRNAIEIELRTAGWQDPAIIIETGLCAWKSGPVPALDIKTAGEFLFGKMALFWTGSEHTKPTGELLDLPRDYLTIKRASRLARDAVIHSQLDELAEAVSLSYHTQLAEGCKPLPTAPHAMAYKYCGSGHGGYAVYLFPNQIERDLFVRNTSQAMAIEPYLKHVNNGI